MYRALQQQLTETVRAILDASWHIQLTEIVLEQPPDLALGEFALPVAFELARRLRKAPRQIAAELAEKLAAALTPADGFLAFEAAGAGYINVRLDRARLAAALAAPVAESDATRPDSQSRSQSRTQSRILVEHTSINPNKAAHVGHLRNAILGDTLVRILRAAGHLVDVQNYIDNTGVQVADVIVGFLHLEGKTRAEIDALIAAGSSPSAREDRFDYLCWNLYARVSHWYTEGDADEQARRKSLRYQTLHAIEQGGNETALVADRVSTAILRLHLVTMQRLGITYDFLPRESEILHLHFWDRAFELLKASGVLYHETSGKNSGCWVMTRAGTSSTEASSAEDSSAGNAAADGEPAREQPSASDLPDTAAPDRSAPDPSAPDEDAKVIVRSNGTVTYVGKDIAYHLWKFGLLGVDFAYRRFFDYPDHTCWISSMDGESNTEGEASHPRFGGAAAIYNVIDSRQSDPQANVIQALRGMGHTEAADHYTHFSYEMVALTPRCAQELGYTLAEEDRSRPWIEVSGRKGFGVKADDLLDKLTAATRAEVDARQPDRSESERQRIATQIAIGALRYFMLKFTRGSVIAFDFRDALSFEGETGPYVQYTAVRARNIFRKAGITPEAALEAMLSNAATHPDAAAQPDAVTPDNALALLAEANDIWPIWLRAARRHQTLTSAISTAEPATLARHVFQLAQEFNNFYHKHHILTEEDPARKTLLLATAAIALRELTQLLDWLGVEVPEAM